MFLILLFASWQSVASSSPPAQEESAFDLTHAKQAYAGQALKVLDISERNRKGKNVITVTLSVPVDPATDIQPYFDISTNQEGSIEGGWEVSPSGKAVWFNYTEPNTEYLVIVRKDLTAANDMKLGTTIRQKLTTRHLISSVNFDSSGAFLPEGFGSGIPIASVNVDQVDIDFFRIKPKKVSAFISSIGRRHRYYNVEYLTKLGDLTYSGRYDLKMEKNTRISRQIQVRDQEELQAPGIYLAVMRVSGEYQKKQLTWFSVTDIGLHVRRYDDQLDVYASSLATGKALGKTRIKLLDREHQLLEEGISNAEGMVTFSQDLNKAFLVMADKGRHSSLVELQKPALDLSAFDLGERPQRPSELFIYTPRDIFRPGELIDFNALLRDQDGEKTHAPTLKARLRRPNGSIAKNFRWREMKAGYYHHPWQIPSDASTGNWQLEVTLPEQEQIVFPFKVEEFLPERMKLTHNPELNGISSFAANDIVIVDVLGEYLYGAPAAQNRLSTSANISLWRSPIETLKDYQFGDITETTFNQNIELSDMLLNAEGRATLELPSRWQNSSSPLRVKFINSLYESGGRPVSRTYSSLIWPKQSLIGIRPHFGDSNPEMNSQVNFDIVNATVEGKLLKASNLDVKLVREDRQYFWVYNDRRGWHWEWTDKEFVEQTHAINIAVGKSGRLSLPVNYGRYRLEVTNHENSSTSSLRFYVGYDWYSRWRQVQNGANSARPDQVTLALDKEKYQSGDIAKLKIVPPTAGEAIILVEGETALWSTRIPVAKTGSTVDIPIDESWKSHNLYISAVVLQASEDKETIAPKRSFGLLHLPLDRDQRRLDIDIDVPENFLPEKTLNANIQVTTGSNNNTAKGPLYITLAAVDVGVLSITNYKTPDPHKAFFGQRRYEVDVLDMYHKVIERSNAPYADLRFGGDEDLQRGGEAPLSEVQIVSVFSGLVETDAHGKATIPINIPDFNGRIRLMALAFSNNAFGHSEKDVTIAAPIVTQAAMPRFLAFGDTANLALDIRNMTDSAQALIINAESLGPIKMTAPSSTLTLKAKEKRTLLYPLEAIDYEGQATFSFKVAGESIENFQREWKLGVRPAYPAIIEQKRKVIQQGERFKLSTDDLPQALPSTLKSRLVISPKADFDIEQQMKKLLQYPYGCLEQTTSRAFPLTFATRENQRRFNLPELSDAKRIQMIEKGISRITSLALNSGGYGLWSSYSPEQHWLTAYVADFLLNARDMGMEVPPELIDKTMRRLQQYVNRSSGFVNERWSENNTHYRFAYKAYAAYVLAKVNQAPLGSLRQLYDQRFDDAQSGLSQVQLGLALLKMGDKKRGMAALSKAVKNIPQSRRYWGDYGSNIRDLGMMIYLLISHDVLKQDAMQLSNVLADVVRDKRWLSTQERTALFLAGIAIDMNSQQLWQAEFNTYQQDGTAVRRTLKQEGVFKKLLQEDDIAQGLDVTPVSDSTLFVSLNMMGHNLTAPKPSSKGLSIARQYYNTRGEAVDIKNINVGDLFIAHLAVDTENRNPDVLVVDLLPAGLELENQNLEHAIKLDEFKIDGKSVSQLQQYTQLQHEEYRDDRYVAAIDLNGYQTAHLFYLVRAVSPGEYAVPSPLAEDMYRPYIRAIGSTQNNIRVENRP